MFDPNLELLLCRLPDSGQHRLEPRNLWAIQNTQKHALSRYYNPENQSPITNFRWEFVKRAFGKKYNLTYCTRQYIIKKMKNPYVLGYEDWYVGAVNNENQFYGGNINQAQALYYKNI